MSHHVLRDCHFNIPLPVMHLEFEPDEVGQDRRAARLGSDWGRTLAGFGADNGEAEGGVD